MVADFFTEGVAGRKENFFFIGAFRLHYLLSCILSSLGLCCIVYISYTVWLI